MKPYLELNFDYHRPSVFSSSQQAEGQVKGSSTVEEVDYSFDAFFKHRGGSDINIGK